MGYFDKYLMHEDGRDKGMNSTSSEKGTDGKKNNTSEYNHQYYMKNKDKWRDNKSSVSVKGQWDKEGDKDFDRKANNAKSVPGTDYEYYEKPDGSVVILCEDMKWVLPPGVNKGNIAEKLKEVTDREDSSDEDVNKIISDVFFNTPASGEKEFDVDAAARDVIRGKYGNGAERRAALGDDYAEVQKRVNEILGGKTSSEPKKTSKNTSKPVDGPKETPHANFPSSNSTNSAPRAREKNVTGTGTGLYRRDKVEDNKPRKREKNVSGNGTGLYTRGKVAHSEFVDRSESLEHHGILGQKWGVRRFEKAGGGLTAAGKARYQTDSNGNYKKLSKEEQRARKDAVTKWGTQSNQPSSARSSALAGTYAGLRISTGKDPKLIGKALDKSNDADEKRWKAAKKARSNMSDEEIKETEKLVKKERAKKALKIGAAVTATALATYGAYKINQLNKKAIEGIRAEADHKKSVARMFSNMNRQNAYDMQQTANKLGSASKEASRFVSGAKEAQKRADDLFMEAERQWERSKQKNFSVKEKVNYLKDNNELSDFTMNLLKKNNATLSSLGF